ncbi:MAG: ATP adenylyltransferase [Cyanobium sp. NAT70]|nr:ATP adenylyltransferase [Cyanobium sp. NAT70]
MGIDRLWQRALECSDAARAATALVPLSTSVRTLQGESGVSFEIRHLTSAPPRHLRAEGPKPNPFRPWDPRLQIETIGANHVLILNKYPVQIGHMLLITRTWQPQSGWLSLQDWNAVAMVDQDTTGLWFFNSGPSAGASQPHRHLQLLPRRKNDPLCPRHTWFEQRSKKHSQSVNHSEGDCLSKSCAVLPINASPLSSQELNQRYQQLCERCGLGSPNDSPQPSNSYNILLSRTWMAMILRQQEGSYGFSVNALGFAGYLLSTASADCDWLNRNGPEALLKHVVQPIPSS